MCELLDNVLLFKAGSFIARKASEPSIAFYLLIDFFADKYLYSANDTSLEKGGDTLQVVKVTKMHRLYHASIFNLQNQDPIDNNESDQSA